jgi:serine protease
MKRIYWLVLSISPLLFYACGGGGGGGGGSAPPSYTISGTITAAAGNQVDSDINDTGLVPVTNNGFSSAQTISVPGVIGGYINASGFGDNGNSYENGDTSDFYQAGLDAGTTIRIALPDETGARVVLSVYDTVQNLITRANDIDQYAALSVNASGTYFIQVRIVSGATSYRLMVGSVSDLPLSSSLGQSADFVPGEVLVQLKTEPEQRASRAAAMTGFVQRSGLNKVSTDARGWMRLRADDRETVFKRLNINRRSAASPARSRSEEVKIAKEETLRLVQALRRQPDVAHAQPNFIRRPYYIPENDPLYSLQWNLEMLHLPDAWEHTLGSAQVIVAVIDTGILSAHPDISGKIANGYDFISDLDNARDGDGIDGDPEDMGDGYAGDSSYHGTHTAGIIAAAFDNGLGVTGIGGATMLMPVRVLGPEGGTDWDIARAIRWAAGYNITDDDGNVHEGANPPADIINMSLGGPDYSEVLENAVIDAYNGGTGAIMFAAAGNTPDGEPSYPAAFPEVFSVSAVDTNGDIAYYSNFGPTVFVAAPGGDVGADVQPDGYADGVLSTMGSDLDGPVEYQYSYYQGTSMAAAHLSGVAALMKAARSAADPDNPLLPDEFYGYLVSGQITSDLGAVGDDDFYGYGLIDAYQAVLAAEAGDPPPALSVTPLSLRFDTDSVSATLFARQVGSGDLSLSEVTKGTDWLNVIQSSGQTGAGDFGQYTVTVNRTNLPGGIYTDYIEFVTSANTVRIPVSMEVLPDRNATAAIQYLLLIDADTMDTVDQQALLPSNGQYSFTFQGVPPGTYYLISGSDLNNDFSLLDQGEAVGGYETLNEWLAFTVDRDLSGLNFITGFTQWPSFLPATLSAAGQRRP